MSNTKQLDLIIWGATGFTGQLVSEYINKKYWGKTIFMSQLPVLFLIVPVVSFMVRLISTNKRSGAF